MYIVSTYSVAVLLCIVTMLCWGSWGNTQKMASQKWPFQLYYWDYSIGILLINLFFAFTLGSTGESGRPFLEDVNQADPQFLWYALLGGIIFNFSNLLLVIAIEIAGMAVAFPIGVGIALVLGVITNYVYAPEGDPIMLFSGVFFVTLAIIFDAIAYKKVAKTQKRSIGKGVIISIMSGVAMGFFYNYVAQSISPDFATPVSGMLTPYTALVFFSLGIVGSNFIFNSVNMYRPLSGTPVTYRQYFSVGTPRLHFIGILGGIIWGIGMAFSIISSEKAGPAISYGLGQGATMVAVLWGVFVWKELKELPNNGNWLILSMFIFFLLGLILIIFSRTV